MTNRQYDAETKAAVMAALLTGQAVGSVAAEYDIPEGTVKSWRARAKSVAMVDPQKKGEVGDLLLAYLRASLTALEAQARVFADVVWLREQPASELAVLHGVMTDKAIRLMEAFGRADGNDLDAAD